MSKRQTLEEKLAEAYDLNEALRDPRAEDALFCLQSNLGEINRQASRVLSKLRKMSRPDSAVPAGPTVREEEQP